MTVVGFVVLLQDRFFVILGVSLAGRFSAAGLHARPPIAALLFLPALRRSASSGNNYQLAAGSMLTTERMLTRIQTLLICGVGMLKIVNIIQWRRQLSTVRNC